MKMLRGKKVDWKDIRLIIQLYMKQKEAMRIKTCKQNSLDWEEECDEGVACH